MKHRAAQLVIELAVPAALLSCSLVDPGQAPSTNEVDAGARGARDETLNSTIDSDTRVTLERTQCYGACPAYSLSIAGDGTVAYFGSNYVHVKGPASKQVSVSDVQALVDQMLRADYFNLSVPEDCPAGIFTDAPSATTSLTLHGRTHTVEHYHGNACSPAILGSLEDAIDIVADSAAWIVCDNPGGICCDVTVNPYLPACRGE
jgi:hypothetical protein